jgi:hypothetical protein
MDDIRVTKGLARWTSDFTPPLKTTALINGDTDEEYRLITSIVNGAAAAVTYCYRLNNDSGANYGLQQLSGVAAVIAAARLTGQVYNILGYADAINYLVLSDVLLYVKSGYLRTSLNHYAGGITGTTVSSEILHGHVWNNTTAPVSALQILAGTASGLGVGSKFLLYRKVQ